jgi:hypothetical protein
MKDEKSTKRSASSKANPCTPHRLPQERVFRGGKSRGVTLNDIKQRAGKLRTHAFVGVFPVSPSSVRRSRCDTHGSSCCCYQRDDARFGRILSFTAN